MDLRLQFDYNLKDIKFLFLNQIVIQEGKLTQIGNNQYRFDAGPSLFTMPEKVNELLIFKVEHLLFLIIRSLNEVCRYFYEDGTVVKGFANQDLFAQEIKTKLGVSENVTNYLSKTEFIFNALTVCFWKIFTQNKNLFFFHTLYSFLKLPFLNVGNTMDDINTKHLR